MHGMYLHMHCVLLLFYKHIVKKNMQSPHKYSQIKNVSTLYNMN